MQCLTCLAVLPPDAQFCPMCGSPTAPATGPTQRLDEVIALGASLVDSRCPKCGSTEIYVEERGLVAADRGQSMALTLYTLYDVWRGRTAMISTYICATCGYIELYAAEKSRLPEIIKSWRRVVR